MNQIDILKQAITFVSAEGVREIITNVVKTTMPTNVSRLSSLSISTATLVLTSMVTDQMADHIDKKVDEINEKIQKMREAKT